MKITIPAKTIHISACGHECPYFTVSGMERMMECEHPVMIALCDSTKDAYANLIISNRDEDKPFPKRCPLVAGEQK